MLGVAIPGIAPLAPGVAKEPSRSSYPPPTSPSAQSPGPYAPPAQNPYAPSPATIRTRRADDPNARPELPPAAPQTAILRLRAHRALRWASARRGRRGVRTSLAQPGAAPGRSARRPERNRSASHHLRHVPRRHRAAHRRDQGENRREYGRPRARHSAQSRQQHLRGRHRSAGQRARREGVAGGQDWLSHPSRSLASRRRARDLARRHRRSSWRVDDGRRQVARARRRRKRQLRRRHHVRLHRRLRRSQDDRPQRLVLGDRARPAHPSRAWSP